MGDPGERLKILMQTSTNNKRRLSPLAALSTVRAGSGTLNLFTQGLGATVLREVPGCIVWFAVYELAHKALQGEMDDRRAVVASSGSVAGATAWACMVPADCVKSVQQASSQPVSTGTAARRLWQQAGLFGFFTGFGIITSRGAIADACNFSFADVLRQQIEKSKCNEENYVAHES